MTTTEAEASSVPVVGDAVTDRETYYSLPIGSTFRTATNRVWKKVSDDVFESETTRNHRNIRQLSIQGTNRVASVGPQVTAEAEPVGDGVQVTVQPETLEQFKQRFETIMWGCTITQGVDSGRNDAAMRELECLTPQEALSPGMLLARSDSRLARYLPDETVIANGFNPMDPGYCVMRVSAGRFHTLLGRDDGDAFGLWRVVTMPGVEPKPYVTGEWDPSMPEAIHAWKRRAYAVGMRVKSHAGWCGTFDTMLARADVDTTARDPFPGVLSAEQVAEHRAGTMVRYEGRGGQTAFLMRDDTATNPARTRSLGGSLGDWAPHNLVVVGTNGNLSVPVKNGAEMISMPVGTQAVDVDSNRIRYTKESDGTWVRPDVGRYRPQDFNYMRMRYVRIGN